MRKYLNNINTILYFYCAKKKSFQISKPVYSNFVSDKSKTLAFEQSATLDPLDIISSEFQYLTTEPQCEEKFQ